MKKYKKIVLPLVLVFFTLLFMATSRVEPCDDDCEKVRQVSGAMYTGRESYVYHVQRCSRNLVSDSLCMYVKDTTGINWVSLADTLCMEASRRGLNRQKIFILKTTGQDTLFKNQCP